MKKSDISAVMAYLGSKTSKRKKAATAANLVKARAAQAEKRLKNKAIADKKA